LAGCTAPKPIAGNRGIGAGRKGITTAGEKYQGTYGVVGAVNPATTFELHRVQLVIGTIDTNLRGYGNIGKYNFGSRNIRKPTMIVHRPAYHYLIVCESVGKQLIGGYHRARRV